jgi:hypothetical protein
MPTWNDAIAIAKTLPEVEVTRWYGTPGLKVAGKGFARLRSEAEGGLVLMCSLDEKERLLDSDEPAYYTTPHYDGFGSIIVNLKKVSRDALRELIVQAWRIKAPPKLRAQIDHPHFTALGTRAPRAASRGRSRRKPPSGST